MTVAACSSTVRDGVAPGRLHPTSASIRIAHAQMDMCFLVIVVTLFWRGIQWIFYHFNMTVLPELLDIERNPVTGGSSHGA
jgi:hypothetical protein